jgi:uncharacterized membrane protein
MTEVPATAGAPPPPHGIFRVGLVLSRSLTILSRNVLKFLPLTAIMALPDLGLLVPGFAGGAAPRDPAAVFTGAVVVTLLMSLILWLFLYALTEAVVLYGSFQALRNRPVRIGESFQKGLSRLLPIIGLSFCVALAVGFASLALLVPGLILTAMWFVALPACVVERLGPFQSMSRSSALTKGHRWKIFGIYLLLMIINAVVGSVVPRVLIVAGVPIAVLGTMIWHALMGAYQSIVVAVTYHDLRVAKEGVDIEHIASVFD